MAVIAKFNEEPVNFYAVTSAISFAQGFTVPFETTITTVRLWLYRTGSPQICVMSICQAKEDGSPDTDNVVVNFGFDADLLPETATWKEFDLTALSSPVTLSPGNYVIVLTNLRSAPDTIYWGYTYVGPAE